MEMGDSIQKYYDLKLEDTKTEKIRFISEGNVRILLDLARTSPELTNDDIIENFKKQVQ